MTVPPPLAPPVAPGRPVLAPRTALQTAGVVALWLGGLLGLVAKLASPGWGVLVVFLYSPVVLGVPLAAAIVVTSVMCGASAVRRAWPAVPGRYGLCGWLIGVGLLVAGLFFPDAGDVDPAWSTASRILGMDGAPDWMRGVTAAGWLVAAGASLVILVWAVADRRAARRDLAALAG